VNQIWHEFNRILWENDTALYPNIQVVMHEGSLAFYCPPSNQYAHHCPDREIADACFGPPNNRTAGYVPFSCGGDAIQVADNVPLWIHHNIIDRADTSNKFDILFTSVLPSTEPYSLIEHNTFIGPNTEGSGGTQLYVGAQDQNLVIRYNKFLAPHSAAIFFHSSDNAQIYGNIVTGGIAGFVLSDNNSVYNNVFYNNTAPEIIYPLIATGGIVRNNIFYNLPGQWVYNGNFVMTASNNLFYTDEDVFGTEPVIGNPLFVNPAAGDFHLQEGSPAIDAGIGTGYAVDPDGVSVPQGDAPDIGVYEYEGGVSPVEQIPTNRPLRILFLGNSFTTYGTVGDFVDYFAVSEGWPNPVTQVYGWGSYSLNTHRFNATSLAYVDQGNWDFVVLQEYSTKPTDSIYGNATGFKQDVAWFYDRIKATSPNAKIILYETWARHPDHDYYPIIFLNHSVMQAQLRYHYNDAANNYVPSHVTYPSKNDIEVAPVGDVWEQHLYFESNPLRLHDVDNYHASWYDGIYLNGLVLYSTIYNSITTGLGTLGNVSPSNAARLQQSVDAFTDYTCGDEICGSGESCSNCIDCACVGGQTCQAGVCV
jgi:parallel beta-helix repeat protein